VHDHFEESDGRDTDVFEVVRIFAPETSFIFGFDGGRVVGIESIACRVSERDGIGELYERGTEGG